MSSKFDMIHKNRCDAAAEPDHPPGTRTSGELRTQVQRATGLPGDRQCRAPLHATGTSDAPCRGQEGSDRCAVIRQLGMQCGRDTQPRAFFPPTRDIWALTCAARSRCGQWRPRWRATCDSDMPVTADIDAARSRPGWLQPCSAERSSPAHRWSEVRGERMQELTRNRQAWHSVCRVHPLRSSKRTKTFTLRKAPKGRRSWLAQTSFFRDVEQE